MTIQEQLEETSVALALLDPNNRGDLAEISRLTTLHNELLAQASLEARVQVQEEKVESITLPYNFDEIFEDPRANEMIIELIKEYQRAAYAEHNAELTELATAHREELRIETSRTLQLKLQNEGLQTKWELQEVELDDLQSALNHMRVERDDALSKRDAAVREKEGLELLVSEKQEQIDKLRDEIAIGAVAAVNVTNISPTDRLAVLVQESKNAKVKSALDIALENTAPFRGKVIVDQYGQAVAPLVAPEVSPFPFVNSSSDPYGGVDTAEPNELPTVNQEVDFRVSEEGAIQAVSATVAQGDAGTVGQGEKTLEQRVAALELKVFGE